MQEVLETLGMYVTDDMGTLYRDRRKLAWIPSRATSAAESDTSSTTNCLNCFGKPHPNNGCPTTLNGSVPASPSPIKPSPGPSPARVSAEPQPDYEGDCVSEGK